MAAICSALWLGGEGGMNPAQSMPIKIATTTIWPQKTIARWTLGFNADAEFKA